MRVPLEYLSPRRPLVVVEATVNGLGPLPFVVDTGATITSISPPIAEAISMSTQAGAGVGSGGAFTTSVGLLRTLEFCGVRVERSPAAVIDLRHLAEGPHRPAGILGYSALRHTRLSIDYRARWIEIVPLEGDVDVACLDPARAS